MRRLTLLVAALAGVLVAWCPYSAQAAPGDLDSTFGDSGIVRTHIGAPDSFDRSDAMVLDASGRAVVVGGTSTPIGDSELVLARYLSDGSLDASFGTGGIVKSDAGYPHAVALDGDGNIVVVGQVEADVLVARFLPSGAPDTSFGGGDGVVVTDFTGEVDSARAVAIDGSGRIVIAGGAPHVLLARYLANGDLDTSFGGGDGFVAETIDELFGIFGGFHDVAIDGSGRIVAVGGGFVAMRFLASGTLDTSFGDEGMVGHRVEEDDEARAVAIDPAGNILVGGRTGFFLAGVPANFNFAVVRYSETGVLDTAFGDGDSMAVADAGEFDTTSDMALDGNGRVVLSGWVFGDTVDDFAVVRFLPNGRISGGFGGDGIVTTDLGGEEFGMAVAVDPDGRIMLSGSVDDEDAEENGFADFALLRYEGGPAVDVFHDLSVHTAGEGEGTVTGLGIDCGTTCTATYDEGTVVTLTATPIGAEFGEAEAAFTGWSGDCTGEAETCDVTMDAAKEVAANFEPLSEEEPPVEEPPEEEPPPASSPPTTPPAAPEDGAQPAEPTRPSLAAAGGLARVIGNRALLRLRCAGQAACRGIAKLVARLSAKQKARRSAAARARNVVLGQSRFRVPTGKAKVVRIRLNGQGMRLLQRAGQRGVRARLVGRGLRNRALRLVPKRGNRRRPMLWPAAAQGTPISGDELSFDVSSDVKPERLPRRGYAPARLSVAGRLTTVLDRTQLSALRSVEVRLDRRLRIASKGLTTCATSQLTGVAERQARKRCGKALVGTGTLFTENTFGETPPNPGTLPLLLFNAKGSKLLMYSSFTYEAPAALVSVGIARGNKLLVPMPRVPFAGTTGFRFRIGRTWRDGRRRFSYLNGQCSTGNLVIRVTLKFSPSATLSGRVPDRCRS